MGEEQEKKAIKIRYENRKTNILKKGKELSTLCDVKVCVIVVSPDGKLETWPDNLNDVKAVLSAVKGSTKPIRSENHRNKKGGGGGDRRRLCSRIKIGKGGVKGKEIERENCVVFRNNAACVVDEAFYDVSGSDQENKNGHPAGQLYNFGMGIPDSLTRANQAPSSYCPNHWNGNEKSNCENFGKYINMVTNEEPNNVGYYGCGRHESGNNLDRYHHQYEIGSSSSSAFNSGLNFSNILPNQEPPTLIASYHPAYHQQQQQQQYVIGNSSAFSSGLNNMVHSNQEPSSLLAYQQYEIGSSSGLNSGVNNDFCNMLNPNQEHTTLAYQQYEIGIWE